MNLLPLIAWSVVTAIALAALLSPVDPTRKWSTTAIFVIAFLMLVITIAARRG